MCLRIEDLLKGNILIFEMKLPISFIKQASLESCFTDAHPNMYVHSHRKGPTINYA